PSVSHRFPYTTLFRSGFAERLMPDMIDRLVARAGKTMQPAASPSQSNGNKPLFLPNPGSGKNGNGIHRPARPATRRRPRVKAGEIGRATSELQSLRHL